MRITSKGQVTVPIAIREATGLLPHTEVEFVLRNGDVVLRRAATQPTRGQRVVGVLKGRASSRMTTDEIMALTREG